MSSPFLTKIIFVQKTISQSLSIPKIELCFIPFIWTPWKISLLNLKYSQVVQHRKKIGSQQSREEKQRAIIQIITSGFMLSQRDIFSIPRCFRDKAQERWAWWKASALPTLSYAIWFLGHWAKLYTEACDLLTKKEGLTHVSQNLLLWNGSVWVPFWE